VIGPTPISASRELQQRRISRVTKGIALASVAATVAFALAAAHGGKVSSGSASTGEGAAQGDEGNVSPFEDELDSPTLTPSQSAPSQSAGPPVASSGGS
jgi:hypothetical protein